MSDSYFVLPLLLVALSGGVVPFKVGIEFNLRPTSQVGRIPQKPTDCHLKTRHSFSLHEAYAIDQGRERLLSIHKGTSTLLDTKNVTFESKAESSLTM